MNSTINRTSGAAQRSTKEPTLTYNELTILLASRIRLNDEERAQLKTAYQRLRAGYAPVKAPNVGGSSIQVETAYTANQLDAELGMNAMTFSDVVNSRESIALPMVLTFQKVLGVSIVTPERLDEAYASYRDFVFAKHG